jgi:hypothetical protein
MYSFAPMADTTDVHTGFYFLLIVAAIALLVAFFNATVQEFSIVAVICGVILFIAHGESYFVNHPLNQQVTGTFVAFQPEGYRESTGKSRADKHYMYVVYKVDGQLVILQANEGSTYPKTATLYKN